MSHTITALTDFAAINEGAGKKLYAFQIGATGVYLPTHAISDESGNTVDAITGTPSGAERGIVARIAPVGQKTMAGSIPVVLPSDQTVPVSVSGTVTVAETHATNGTQVTQLYDASQAAVVSWGTPKFAVSEAVGQANAIRVLDTSQAAGAQMVTAKGDQTTGIWVNIKNSPNIPVNIHSFGGTSTGLGQHIMATSMPVVVSSDQSAIPVSGTFWQATQPVSGTFWQATQPVSNTQLPSALVGARLDINNGSWFGSTAPTVGSKVSANSIPVVIASDQAALPVTQFGATPFNDNISQLGGTVISAVTIPTGGDGQPAFPVQINAVQKLTYDIGVRNVITGALTANTTKAVLSFEHGATSVKTVRIRRIVVHAIQTTALSGLFEIQITSGTAASSAGTAQTVIARKGGDAAPEVVVKLLPTITAASVHDYIPAGGFATTTTLYSPPVLIYDWQEGGEMKPYILRAGVLESLVLNVVSTAAHNLTMTISVDLTEE